MPRFSKSRSSKGGSKRGISNHQVCISSAIDEHDNFFLETVGTGPITSEEVELVFKDRIYEVTFLITDYKSPYEKSSKKQNIKLKQIKSGTYVDSNRNIKTAFNNDEKKAIINNWSVNSNNGFDNTSGIDFNTVYADYEFTPPANYDKAKKIKNFTIVKIM